VLALLTAGSGENGTAFASGDGRNPGNLRFSVAFFVDQQQSGESLADRLKAVQSGHSATPVQPAWKAYPAASTAPAIPLVQGLVVVFAVNSPRGDYESLMSVQNISPTRVTLALSAELPAANTAGLPGGAKNGVPNSAIVPAKKSSATRLVDVADLATAHGLMQFFRWN
jgi:hypothetical protein